MLRQPGPVLLEIPQEVGTATGEMAPYAPAVRGVRTAGDPERIQAAAELLAGARRPLIVAGGGARISAAHEELRQLAELVGAPVMTTPSGRGAFPEDHPLALGRVGLYRSRLGAKAFSEADLLITVGSRNEEAETAAWRFFPPQPRCIQVDISPFEIGRNWVPDVPIVGDARLVLAALVAALKPVAKAEWQPRIEGYARAAEAYRAEVAAECLRDQLPDFLQMARAYSCYGEPVEGPEEVQAALARALQTNGGGVPAALDFLVDSWGLAEGLRVYNDLRYQHLRRKPETT